MDPRGAERSHCSEWGALDGFLPSSDVVWGRPGGEGREKEGSTPGQGFLARQGQYQAEEKSSRKTRDRDWIQAKDKEDADAEVKGTERMGVGGSQANGRGRQARVTS